MRRTNPDRVRELFAHLRALPGDRRDAALDQECGDDDALREEVTALLAESQILEDLERRRGVPRTSGGGDRLARIEQEADEPRADGALPSGSRLGRYRIIGELGRGGTGIVYDAEDVELGGRRVALKVLRPDSIDEHDRFLKEAATTSGIEHHGVVKVYAAERIDDHAVIAMECVDGPSLQSVLRWRAAGCEGDHDAAGKPIPRADEWRRAPVRIACQTIRDVARGIAAAHRRHVRHRDVKPANILLRPEDGSPVVVDFGIATTEGDVDRTATVGFKGSVKYAAPEQIRSGPGRTAPTVDVYALGATLFETLTLNAPFTGSSVLAILERVTSEEPAPRLRSVATGLSRDLENICLAALEKRPEKRYPTPNDFADDLDRFLAFEPVHARSIGPWTRLHRWSRRHPAASVGVLLSAVILIGSVAAAIALRASTARSWFASAQAAAKRGLWSDALSHYTTADSFGYDDVAVSLGKIEAWHATMETDRALSELKAIRNESDHGPYRAKVLLLTGLLGHDRIKNPNAGLSQIQAALDLHEADNGIELTAADAAFARAYLADSIAEMRAHLIDAVEADPSHQPALQSLIWTEIILGNNDAARNLVIALRPITPESTASGFLGVFVEAAAGNFDLANQMIEENESSWPSELVFSLGAAIQAFQQFAEIEQGVLDLMEGGDSTLDLLATMTSRFLPMARLLLGAMNQEQDNETQEFEVSLPPAVARLIPQGMSLLGVFLRSAITGADVRGKLDEVIEEFPSPFLLTLRGTYHLDARNLEQAEFDFAMGATTGVGSMPRLSAQAALTALIQHEQRYLDAGQEPPEWLLRRFPTRVNRVMKLGGYPPTIWRLAYAGAHLHATDLKLPVILAWLEEHPDDPDALRRLKELLD